jgi:MFS family permease
MPSQLTERYAFSTLHVGLMYMPLAAGSGIAILIAGRLIDRSFRRHAARAGVAIVKGRQQDLARINVERARLEVVLPMLVLSAAVMFSWGWVLQADAHWGYIIMLMFILGMCIAVANNASNTLIIECCPGRVAAGIAANNISRCLVGAAMTAAIEPLITAIGPGLAFIVIGWLYLTCVPIALVLMRWGMGWRLKSAEKQRLKKERKEAEKALAS